MVAEEAPKFEAVFKVEGDVAVEIELHGSAYNAGGQQGKREEQQVEPVALPCTPGRKFVRSARTVFGRVWVRRRRKILGRHDWTAARRVYCSVCSSLPGLKRTALPGGMETSAPVRGLRPIPVLRGLTLNTPKPRNSMRSPCSRAFFMDSKTVSTAISALVLVMPVRLTTSLIMSSLIKTASWSSGGTIPVPHQSTT